MKNFTDTLVDDSYTQLNYQSIETRASNRFYNVKKLKNDWKRITKQQGHIYCRALGTTSPGSSVLGEAKFCG